MNNLKYNFLALSILFLLATGCTKTDDTVAAVTTTGISSHLSDYYDKSAYTLNTNYNFSNNPHFWDYFGSDQDLDYTSVYYALVPTNLTATGLVTTAAAKPIGVAAAYNIDIVKTLPGTYSFTIYEYQIKPGATTYSIYASKAITLTLENLSWKQGTTIPLVIKANSNVPLTSLLTFAYSGITINSPLAMNGVLAVGAVGNSYVVTATKYYDNGGYYTLNDNFFAQ